MSGGVAIGRARWLAPEDDSDDLSGAVVLAPTIEPGRVPFLAGAAAIVVERGGELSHVALLARQLSIPAVCAPGIRQQIADGCRVRVDADVGTIEVLDDVPVSVDKASR
jgi:pyruvate,water dikinase